MNKTDAKELIGVIALREVGYLIGPSSTYQDFNYGGRRWEASTPEDRGLLTEAYKEFKRLLIASRFVEI